MSVKRIGTVPSGAAAGRRLGRSDPTVDAISWTDGGASRTGGAVAALPGVARRGREPEPPISGAPWAATAIPQPRIDHTGQKFPPPLAAQMPIRRTLTST